MRALVWEIPVLEPTLAKLNCVWPYSFSKIWKVLGQKIKSNEKKQVAGLTLGLSFITVFALWNNTPKNATKKPNAYAAANIIRPASNADA